MSMVLILQSDPYARIIDLYLWIESANMDISEDQSLNY